MSESQQPEPRLAAPLFAAYSDPEGMELLLRAIVDQWERKEDVEGGLPSYFIESVVVEYVEKIATDKVKIDWARSCLSIQAPLIPTESEQSKRRRELEYQTNYLPICGGIKEQQALQLGAMLNNAARERVIGRYLERYKRTK